MELTYITFAKALPGITISGFTYPIIPKTKPKTAKNPPNSVIQSGILI